MRSEDWIEGTVLRVLSAHVFEMQVTRVGINNDFPYNARERIRLDSTSFTQPARTETERQNQPTQGLLHLTVRCYVRAREAQNTLLCDLEIIAPRSEA